MKEFYSIGETAKLFDMNVQTLRFYEKLGVFCPAYVNPKSGYRYYTQNQFHYLDRIKYLQGMGLSLQEIREILQSGKVDDLTFFLKKTLSEQQEKLLQIQESISDIEWYIDYFSYMDVKQAGGVQVRRIAERYLLSAPCSPNEPFSDIETRLTELKNKSPYNRLHYRRQYGFILNFDDMMQQRFAPTAASIYLKRKPEYASPYITTLPEGLYLCFEARLLINEWDSQEVASFFQANPYQPVFVVANEYEDNLKEYTATPYEIQVYLQKE